MTVGELKRELQNIPDGVVVHVSGLNPCSLYDDETEIIHLSRGRRTLIIEGEYEDKDKYGNVL